jgi:hypothetical protein
MFHCCHLYATMVCVHFHFSLHRKSPYILAWSAIIRCRDCWHERMCRSTFLLQLLWAISMLVAYCHEACVLRKLQERSRTGNTLRRTTCTSVDGQSGKDMYWSTIWRGRRVNVNWNCTHGWQEWDIKSDRHTAIWCSSTVLERRNV